MAKKVRRKSAAKKNSKKSKKQKPKSAAKSKTSVTKKPAVPQTPESSRQSPPGFTGKIRAALGSIFAVTRTRSG